MVSTTNQKNYTVPIVMMVILFAMIAFVTNLAAPMGIVLKNQFGASNFEGMLGNFANFAAYFFMGIPAGKLIERIGYKKTALIGVAVGFIGMVIQLSSGFAGSFAVYVLGAFVAGFSMCILNTVVNPMLNTLGGGGNKGNQLIKTGGTLNSLCGTIVPMLVGALVGDVTKANISNVYPVMYIAMGIFAVIFIRYLRRYRGRYPGHNDSVLVRPECRWCERNDSRFRSRNVLVPDAGWSFHGSLYRWKGVQ